MYFDCREGWKVYCHVTEEELALLARGVLPAYTSNSPLEFRIGSSNISLHEDTEPSVSFKPGYVFIWMPPKCHPKVLKKYLEKPIQCEKLLQQFPENGLVMKLREKQEI